MITKQQIEQYASLKREIGMLAEQIYSAEDAGDYVVDTVRGSSEARPFAVHNIVIKGYTSPRVPRLIKRKAALERRCWAIESFIDELPDSLMRQLLTWRYIEGKSLSKAATLIGYSESQTKRLIKNFFEKMNQNEPK